MPRIYLCFLWHMHQPFYKDLISGEYKLPWTRLHALKDYLGMVQILEDFPAIKQTFNLVPSMMLQVEEYANGQAADPYLHVALKPAETLDDREQDFLLRNFFLAYPPRMIYRYPRYGELYEAWQAYKDGNHARRLFGKQEYRDLQVLSQLAWFDEEFQAHDPVVRRLIERGRNYTEDDQKLMGEKQREIMGRIVPAYRRFAASGQIEISTTPFYHPILPLICDSNIARVSHPNVPLPPPFRYPQDAREQLELARQFIRDRFGVAPAGLWPSEGSVSDQTLTLAYETGFRWTATDSGVLARTLDRAIGVESIYCPYRWSQSGHDIGILFRDHFLSDLIGFVYSKMGASEAAADFLRRIRENCRGILAAGRDALVPIILDGENAWEYYDRNGRPFLRDLYTRISNDPQMSAITVSEAFAKLESERLNHIFPGSWINANFDVWIGAEEDNQAWTQLLRARQAFDEAKNVSEPNRRLAYEELLIAEGSDWCWWYGPEHDSAQRPDFDRLYRAHLANVYRALGRTPPEELSRSILRTETKEVHFDPTGPVTAVIDGEVTSYFEWIGAGIYRTDERSGSMHGKRFLVRELQYGRDATRLYLRLDFQDRRAEALVGIELRINVHTGPSAAPNSFTIRLESGGPQLVHPVPSGSEAPIECAFSKILEVALPLAKTTTDADAPVRLQCSLWENGLPMDAIPQQGWLDVRVESSDWVA